MEKKNKKRKKLPKKIIAASLLAIVLVINFVYSSLENVEARGMFASVETKAREAYEGKDSIKVLEILPDSESMGMFGMLIKGQEPFKDIIKDYTDEEIHEFAEILNKYGMVNMDSTTSAVYPLTYYKPGEQDQFTSNVPDLTDEQVGYGLSEQKLVAGYFQEVSVSELENEKVYYQEIIVTVTPVPTEAPSETPAPEGTEAPTPTVAGSEPTEIPEATETPSPTTEGTTVTVTPAPTEGEAAPTAEPTQKLSLTPTTEVTTIPEATLAPTVTEASETAFLNKNIRNSVLVAQADVNIEPQKEKELTEKQLNQEAINEGDDTEPTNIPEETVAPTEQPIETPTGQPTEIPTAVPTLEPTKAPLPTVTPLSEVYFTDEDGNTIYLNYSEEGLNNSTESGRFFRFVAEEEGVQIPENSFKGMGYQFVFVSRAEIRNNDLFKRFVLGITDETQLQNDQMIELTTVSVDSLVGISNLAEYDLVYMAQPVFYNPAGTDQILEWAYANPDVSKEDKQEIFSPWVTLASTQNDSYDMAARRIIVDAISGVDPLKLVIDTSILEEFERAITFYSDVAKTLEGMDAAAISEETLEVLKSNGIYKALLMLAQDDFVAMIQSICTEENKTYVLDNEMWEAEKVVDICRTIIQDSNSMFQMRKGHYVNKNIYFYKHNEGDYDKPLCTVDILSMLNGDFRSNFKKSILPEQFPDVVSAIDHENETNAYFESSREQMDAEAISTDMVLQYLLNYTGQAVEVKKNHISVLEIEPCADFSYDYKRDTNGDYVLDSNGNKQMTESQQEFIKKWINYFAQQNRWGDVSFTCMSMQEFIGKNEDLNSTYDMIYIGSNIGKFKTTSSGVRAFNDTEMTGLVYTHIGDKTGRDVDVSAGLGLLDRDYTSSERTTFSNSSTVARTTGNDLTTYKKRDLLNYLASGYPVIVAENLLTYTIGIDGKKVPNNVNSKGSSNIYELGSSSTQRTLYIKKPKSGFHDFWDHIYVYAWEGSSKNAEWPGVRATYVNSLSDGDYYVYKVTMAKKYSNYKIVGCDGNDTEKGKTVDLSGFGDKDIYTTTLNNGSGTTAAGATLEEGAPVGANSSNVTVDNSTYLYQLLKMATANSQNKEGILNNVTRNTLNSESIIDALEFDWDDRVFPNLLTDGMTDQEAHVTSPEYLNETKVYLNLTKRPNEYKYTLESLKAGKPIDEESINYLEADSTGRYYLEFEFSISTLAGTLSTSDYDCQLLVDANFDGKFSANSEILDSVVIKEAATGQVVTMTEGESVYHLKENTPYTLSRKLPKSFDGCINWKLQVTQNENDKILAAETGYCAIPVTPKKQNGSIDTESTKQKIKILQVTSGTETTEYSSRHTYSGTHVNMQKQMESGTGAWHELLTNIPDFELEITTISAAGTNGFADLCLAYDNAHTDDKGGYALHAGENGETDVDGSGYDMLVIGFIDVFSDVDGGKSNRAVAMAETINKFGESGRSILFTHDTTAWTGNYLHIGEDGSADAQNNSAYLTVAIRDLCGNDQFGLVTRTTDSIDTKDYKAYISQFFKNEEGTATKASATGKSYSMTNTSAWAELLSLGKDIAFRPNTNQTEVVGDTQGSTYTNLRNYNVKWSTGGYASDSYVQYTNGLITSGADTSRLFAKEDDSEQFEIGQINEGAITEYPYILPDSFEVNATHSQYWTVDIESDNNSDDESDLVVWYCINERTKNATKGELPVDDFYKDSPNDVRNNYYIYNKGNITYSGAGHSPISNENEIKLFINTMIAAYNAKLKVPEINIVESGEPEAPDVENIIIPYDASVTDSSSDFVNFGTIKKDPDTGKETMEGQMKIYFNVYDGNLTARDKNIKIDSIFITNSNGSATYTDESGTELKGNIYTDSTQMKIFDATNNHEVGYEGLFSGRTYYIYANIGEIFKTDQSIQLHVKMHTEIGSGSNLQSTQDANDSVTISRAEIFDLD